MSVLLIVLLFLRRDGTTKHNSLHMKTSDKNERKTERGKTDRKKGRQTDRDLDPLPDRQTGSLTYGQTDTETEWGEEKKKTDRRRGIYFFFKVHRFFSQTSFQINTGRGKNCGLHQGCCFSSSHSYQPFPDGLAGRIDDVSFKH